MRWPALSVRARLILTLGVVGVLLLVPALYAASRLARLRDIVVDRAGRQASAAMALGEMRTELQELDRLERSNLITGPSEDMDAAIAVAVERLATGRRALVTAGYGAALRPAGLQLDSLEAVQAALDSLVRAHRPTAAAALFPEAKRLLASTQRALDTVSLAIDTHSRADAEAARAISVAATRTTLIAVLVCLLIAVLVGARSTRALTLPLRRLRSATAKVAGGDFRAPTTLPYARRDEIGELSRSFSAMTRRLAELDHLKAEFLGVATHELKGPITVLGLYAEMIDEALPPDAPAHVRERLAAMLEQTDSLARLVERLMDISRMEAGDFTVRPEETDVARLVDGVDTAFRTLAGREGIRFEVQVEESAPRSVMVDPDLIRDEVLGNLLSNAFKFTPAGGRVRLRARGNHGSLWLRITDTGPGIDPADRPHIFEKYYQAGPRARALGVGLGLAIARQVIEQHGGSIAVRSGLGRGTVFDVRLPATGPKRTQPDRQERRGPRSGAPV